MLPVPLSLWLANYLDVVCPSQRLKILKVYNFYRCGSYADSKGKLFET